MEHKNEFLRVKDHSISGEEFTLLYNSEYDMLETYPQISGDQSLQYYESQDYISHTGAKRNIFEMAYHAVRSISLKRKLKLINSFELKSKTLLDIGCGTGEFISIAKQDNWTVKGIEPNPKARSIANDKTDNEVYDVEYLNNFGTQSFDVITLWHVLEHLPNLDEHISLIKKLLKPDGKIVIAVPNYKSFDACYYKKFWAAFDVPRHLWHFSQLSIKKLFLKENLEIENTLALKFDAYYVSLLSEKYKSGWLNIFNAFFIASRSNLKASISGEFSSLIYVIKEAKKSI
jgi:2-polyprenyl-3-methyl-5-hydroxy-6-metoxy-1,4-benzoquinol methylase